MASIYARGRTLYARIKGYKVPGKWESIKTDYSVGDEKNAERWAQRMEDQIAARGAADGPLTLARFALGEPYAGRDNWVARRKALGVRSWWNEEGHLRLHILPALGSMALVEIRFVHVRDFVQSLIQSTSKKLSARMIRAIYDTLARLFITAVGDEIVEVTPCQLKRGCRELPKRRDADAEWRSNATYTQHEVERLISDPALPADAHVQYALKSIEMLRHGEMAALRWRNYDPTPDPLGRLRIVASYCSRTRQLKETKSGDPRDVPVHTTAAAILAEWKLSGWARVYGRAPTDDDLIVPNLALGYLDGPTAGRRFPRHLRLLGLRERAGARRNRGGHDLRAWGISRYTELGANERILRLSSHGKRGDVMGGYTRGMWLVQCAQIAALKIERLDGEIVELATGLATRSVKQLAYWGKRRRTAVQQARPVTAPVLESAPNPAGANDPGGTLRTQPVASLATELEALADAVLAGDSKLARKLARQARRPAMAAV
jgi:hypothetical protein